MWISIEILLPNQISRKEITYSESQITVARSYPAISHRGDSSLWQREFNKRNGTLYHLGDPLDIKVRNDRYYVYDAIDWKHSRGMFVKFLPRYQRNFERILTTLFEHSDGGEMVVSTDVWLGPTPKLYKTELSLANFLESERQYGLRLNSLRLIQGGKVSKLA